MTIVEVNGQELEFPDDMGQEQIKSVLRQKFPAQQSPRPQTPFEGVNSAMQGQMDAVYGVGQIMPRALQAGLEGMSNFTKSGADMIAPIVPDWLKVFPREYAPSSGMSNIAGAYGKSAKSMDESVKQREQNYNAPEGVDWSRMAGNVLSPVNYLGGGTTLAGKVGYGAAMGMAQPTTNTDNFVSEKALQAGMGGAVPLLGAAAGRVLNPAQDAVRTAMEKAGVNLSLGQKMGGIYNDVEQKLQSAPFFGNMVANRRNEALSQWNTKTINDVLKPLAKPATDYSEKVLPNTSNALVVRGINKPLMNIGTGKDVSLDVLNATDAVNGDTYKKALSDLLEPLGEKVTSSGHEGIKQAQGIISKAYKLAEETMKPFVLDDPAKKAIIDAGGLVAQLPKTEQKAFDGVLQRIQTSLKNDEIIPPEEYKVLTSVIGEKITAFGSSTDAYQRQLADAFSLLQDAVKGAAKRQNPQQGAMMDLADEAFAKMVRIEGAAKSAATNKVNTGVFTPSQLMSAVRGADRSVRDRATAAGDALMQDVAQTGMNVLGNTVPDSGTAGRVATWSMISGGIPTAYMSPTAGMAIAGTGLTGAGLYTKTGQRLAKALLTERPELVRKAGSGLSKYAQYLSGATAGEGTR